MEESMRSSFTAPISETELMRSLATPILEALDNFERSRHDLRESSLRGYKAGIWRFAAYVGEQRGISVPAKHEDARPMLLSITLATLTLDAVNAYITSLSRRKRKTMAHHDARAIVLFTQWCVEARVFERNPLAGLVVPKQPNNRRQPFADEDVRLICKTARATGCGERDEAIVVTAIACGLRKEELRQLYWPDDVDLARGFLYIRDRAAKTEASIRRVPLEREVIAILDAYIEEVRTSRRPGALFLNNHGDPLSPNGFSSIFRRLKGRLPQEMD
ncbi:MAG: tyrosine-type recombinase/integrase, partial [Sporichthyaceae bacterium]